MTPLQRLHYKIQELDSGQEHIPLSTIVQQFDESHDFTIGLLDMLIRLNIIALDALDQNKVILTEWGRLWNIPT